LGSSPLNAIQNGERIGSKVRLRYASIVLFGLNIAGAIFSFFFIALITNKLSIEDYGTWVMILKYVQYMMLPSIIYTLWLPRELCRGQNSARTGLYASFIFGVVSVPLYLILMLAIALNFNQPLVPLLLSCLVLFFEYTFTSLSSISSSYAPEQNGYSSVGMKAGQAIFGFVLVGTMSAGLTGAVIAAIAGRAIMNAISLYYNRKFIATSSFDMSTFKGWLSKFWLPLFGSLIGLIQTLDVIVVRIFYGNEIPIAYYGVCINILTVALLANAVASSLYPKIVSKKNLSDMPEAIWLLLLFSVPVVFAILLYAEPLIAIFGIKYVGVAWALRVFSIAFFIQLLSTLPGAAYQALESLDEKESATTRLLINSAWFKNSLVTLVANSLYLGMLMTFASFGYPSLNFVSIWGAITVFSNGVYLVLILFLLKRDFNQNFPLKLVAKNLAILSAPVPLMMIPFCLVQVSLSENVFIMMQNLALPGVSSFLLYFLCLSCIDKRFRKTIHDAYAKGITLLRPPKN